MACRDPLLCKDFYTATKTCVLWVSLPRNPTLLIHLQFLQQWLSLH
uniref:Serine carboxypeptidase-like 51 n=1 Tax=Rhizophora mucronata TaxID=61149 RepID=A0A2P2KR03_RHIMU